MATIPLEDSFIDVIGKAQKGFKLSDEDLVRRAGLAAGALDLVRRGEVVEDDLRKIARSLNLGKSTLVELARNAWQPAPIEVPGLMQFTTRFGDMMVNAYLAWDVASAEAVAFDTGAIALGLMKAVQSHSLRLKYLLLTHTHGDHVADLDRIRSDSQAEIWVSAKEPLPGVKTFADGATFAVGGLRIETRSTTGHSPGGTTYVIHGLSRPVAVVGDALFAGSMGGGKVSYLDALGSNRRMIMTLPDDCVLCPGHGPLTTVGEEKKHNPFFPEFQKS